MSSMHRPAVGGTSVHKSALVTVSYAHAPRSFQQGSSAFRQHAMRIERRVSRSIPGAAFSATASIANRPRIDAAPTVSAGSDGTVLDCVVVGGGISGLVTAQVHSQKLSNTASYALCAFSSRSVRAPTLQRSHDRRTAPTDKCVHQWKMACNVCSYS